MIDILCELSDMKLNDVLKQLKENLLAIRDYYFIQCALKFKMQFICEVSDKIQYT